MGKFGLFKSINPSFEEKRSITEDVYKKVIKDNKNPTQIVFPIQFWRVMIKKLIGIMEIVYKSPAGFSACCDVKKHDRYNM